MQSKRVMSCYIFFQILTIFSILVSFTRGQAPLPGCPNPQGIYTCYVTYLEKYGIRPVQQFLPPYEELEKYVKTQIDLFNICRDFQDLQQCVEPLGPGCLTEEVFSQFTSGYSNFMQRRQAVEYLQNHAFFEFACGPGRKGFFDNNECLSRAFSEVSLTNRMVQCSRGMQPRQDCGSAVAMSQCVKEQLTLQCGYSAGAASCGAATNIVRRQQQADIACLTEMDAQCSPASAILSFTAILFTYLWLH